LSESRQFLYLCSQQNKQRFLRKKEKKNAVCVRKKFSVFSIAILFKNLIQLQSNHWFAIRSNQKNFPLWRQDSRLPLFFLRVVKMLAIPFCQKNENKKEN
jgi:hypothetical protein